MEGITTSASPLRAMWLRPAQGTLSRARVVLKSGLCFAC